MEGSDFHTDMDSLSMRDLTRMMMDDDRPETFEVCDFTGNYSGDRIRFPGFSAVPGEVPEDDDPKLVPTKVRGDCSTEAWFADKDCKWLVFRDTDGDVAIIHIHALIARAEAYRKQFDEAKAETAAAEEQRLTANDQFAADPAKTD